MSRLRFTLAQLMAVVIFAGFGFAALRSATPRWSSVVFTLTVAVLLAAILAAIARRGRARIMWTGFALFGWFYLGTTFGPWAAGNGVTAPPYLTKWALDYLDARFWAVAQAPAGRMDTGPSGEVLFQRFLLGMPPGNAPIQFTPDSSQFRRIGHSIAAILVGLLGAVLGRLMAAKDERPNP
jgi:hypothetical protein